MKKYIIYLLLPLFLLTFACRSGNETGGETTIKRIYESDGSHAILFDTGSEKGLTLVRDTGALFGILYQTSGNEWLIAERAPFTVGSGRVETTHQLYYLPGKRNINIEELHPALSSYGMWFGEDSVTMSLVVSLKGSPETVTLPLSSLLSGDLPDISIPEEPKPSGYDDPYDPDAEPQFGEAKTDKEAVVLELMLQADDPAVGEALIPRITGDSLMVNSIISYTARNGKIYIVESIQYRVLVYDYEGNFLHAVSYPESLPGRDTKVNVGGIAVEDDFIYLLSPGDNSVYVVDAETEDMVTLISEGGPQSGRFIDLAHLTIDHQGYLRIHDRRRNGKGEIYTYRRDGQMLKWIITEQYSRPGQMVPGPEGTLFRAEVIDGTYKVTRDEGVYVLRNRTRNPMGLASAEVVGADTDGNVYVMCEEFGGQIAGPFKLKIISPQGEELFSLTTSFWDGGGPVMRRVVVTPSGEVFDAYFDGDPYHDIMGEELVVTKLIVERLK